MWSCSAFSSEQEPFRTNVRVCLLQWVCSPGLLFRSLIPSVVLLSAGRMFSRQGGGGGSQTTHFPHSGFAPSKWPLSCTPVSEESSTTIPPSAITSATSSKAGPSGVSTLLFGLSTFQTVNSVNLFSFLNMLPQLSHYNNEKGANTVVDIWPKSLPNPFGGKKQGKPWGRTKCGRETYLAVGGRRSCLGRWVSG